MVMKTKLTRDFYIPKDYVEYKPNIGDYPKDLFACYVSKDKPIAIFFAGKQSKPTWYNCFLDNETMKAKIHDYISRLMSWEDKKKDRANERKAATGLKVGDILYSSWGYDQTNVNFYQVTKLIGKQTVELREIAGKTVSDNGPTTHVTAVPNQFINDKILTRRAPADHGVNISDCQTGCLWNGKPVYETGSGWGH